jgi:hypothetical protein
MDSTAFFMIYIVSGSIGMAYLVYGKKQKNLLVLFAGLALCVYPYLVANPYLLIGIGVVLAALPFIIKI